MQASVPVQPRIANPIIRLVIMLVAMLGVTIVVQLGLAWVVGRLPVPARAGNLTAQFGGVLASLAAYVVLVRVTESRPADELGGKDLFYNLGLGSVVGGGLQALVIFILFLLGMYRVAAVNGLHALLPGLLIALTSGIGEELIFRGVLFRLLEESLGSVVALVITAGIFGAVHLSNPNSSVWSALAIAVEAGVMLGAAYMYTRSLWLPIAIHFAWNFAESGVFGAALSGFDVGSSLLASSFSGPAILTGGEFGPEMSIIAVVLCSTAGFAFLIKSRDSGRFVLPFWKRPKRVEIVPHAVSDAQDPNNIGGG